MTPTRSHAEIKRRHGAARRDRPKVGMAALRIAEIRRLYRDRYGRVLPDDDAGRDDLLVMAQHMARRPDGPRLIRMYIELEAPWMTPDATDELIARVIAKPLKFRADTLAHRLRLTAVARV